MTGWIPTQWFICWGLATLSAVVFLPFGWAVKGHFVRKAGLPGGMKLLTAVSLASYGWMFLNLGQRDAPPRVGEMIATFLLMLTSASLFWWAIAATREKRLHLAHSGYGSDYVQFVGPYRWIRHPFYTSYIVFWVGTGLLGGYRQWLPVIIIIVWYICLARSEEKQFAASPLSADYEAYRRRTGMVLPRLGAFRRSSQC
ncbi:isoprenylcysteine carboxylmethyltransferase family protein [Acetobacteraceae bacterium KSS8]|uniref:Isoprenylcysteine carboxylmethyltransferase family protein n=1 Tax=Endosaccharibacter trunci TaxID=2812733 RepID=A0ABT1W5D8_9PROT|nr:isoprenylcysteine carboxylmethyltransferase family protein [Acetobacteraceae bacterium KSS8]